ncbi:DUF1830 domain-containing protein [Aliterella atlantica]|uniref:DUF1830 domain-containing protein n=1 Tax=Aliterella atlantica CENA595 TaxID=1618023 RepID=A0A0D8ZW50_9CYAN|nr:DUF1830 domain-containing protein [Aliterella atlantica]KJH72622.1 hypothetical protein UH38_05740 [Aliterella atlantica CENA595]
MAQILDPIPPNQPNRIVCCYVNATSKIQIARSSNVGDWYFERVVFPGQRLVFEAPADAVLEIHTGMMASAILSDKIPCDRLALDEESSSAFSQQADQQTLESANEGYNSSKQPNLTAALS